MNAKPNLFIVGAPKCGTTAWVNYLSDHPDVFFSPAKEPHFFCTDFPGFRWARSMDDYEALFAGVEREKVIGEASVQYLYSEAAAANIQAYNPDARIMIFLRDQAEFLPSYHNQLLYNGDETIMDFEAVWKSSPDGANRPVPKSCREPKFLNYRAIGRFSEQIERYTSRFPAEQIKIIQYADWVSNPRRLYLEIMGFLGVEDDGRTAFPRIHGAKHHKSAILARLTQRPPDVVLKGAKLIKKALGRERLGLADNLRSLNAQAGYAERVSDSLKAELADAFAGERARLSAILDGLSDPKPQATDAKR